jgi:GNAT superfamily N-acetyltransferase
MPQRKGPPLTPQRIWRRGCEVWRDGGPTTLALMVLSDLGYGRLLLLERFFDQPIAAVTPRVPVVFSTLDPTQIDEFLRFRGEFSGPDIEARLAAGDHCFLARHDGRIVCASWTSTTQPLFRSLGCRYAPGSSEVYLYDSFTDPAFRGLAIAPALGAHVLELLRAAGLKRATMAVHQHNVANRRARAKTGFRPYERMDYLRLGRRTWHRHRQVERPS